MSAGNYHMRGGRYVSTPEHAQACATALGHANDPELTAALADLFQSIEDSGRAMRELCKEIEREDLG